MSEDKQLNVDESTLAEGKGSLEHVETKTGAAPMKSVLFCGSCSNQEEVPAEWAEMDETPAMPACSKCGNTMAVKLVAA